MAKRYYIAYGSNLNIPQMQMRCPGARVIGTAVIENYELLFKGSKTSSYLTIEPKAGASVPVAAWEVSEADEAALDRYEGFPDFYYKAEMGYLSRASAPARFAAAGCSSTSCTRNGASACPPPTMWRSAGRGTTPLALVSGI